MLPHRYRRGLVAAFFGLLLLAGLRLVPDYGLTYDEETQRLNGEVSLLYVFQQLLFSPQAALMALLVGSSCAQFFTRLAHDEPLPMVRVCPKFLHPLELSRSIQPAAVRQRLEVVDSATQTDHALANYSSQQPISRTFSPA